MTSRTPKGLARISDNVYRADGIVASLGDDAIQFIAGIATDHVLGRARINFHSSDDDLVHEMIIAMTPRSSGPPHFHTGKSESFHLLRGGLAVGLYDDLGSLRETITLSENGCRYYRLNGPLAHMPIALDGVAIFHETTNGPFVKGVSSQIPEWALELTPAEIQRLEHDLRSPEVRPI